MRLNRSDAVAKGKLLANKRLQTDTAIVSTFLSDYD